MTSTSMNAGWPAVVQAGAPSRAALAEVLLAYVRPRRWFRAKARATRGARVADVVMLDGGRAALVFLDIAYADGGADRYLIPLAPVDADGARAVAGAAPHAMVAALASGGAIVDGLATGRLAPLLLDIMRAGREAAGEAGTLRGETSAGLREMVGDRLLPAQASSAEQSNSSVLLGERVLLKAYRQVTAGLNPELELGRVLGAHPRRPPTPRLLGALQYRDSRGAESSVAVAHEFLRNDGDGWSVTLHELRRLFDRLTSDAAPPADAGSPLARSVARARTLGRRTAEVHLALFDAATDPALTPEPLTDADRAAAADGVTATWRALERALPSRLPSLAPTLRADVEHLLDPHSAQRRQLDATLLRFRDQALPVVKTRVHGDLHLGQVLCCRDDDLVDDFVIIDFEGEPARPLAERRAKASPLRDVVGMLRSFDYAPEAALRERPNAARTPELAAFAATWKHAVTDAYLDAYRDRVAGTPFLPPAPALQSLMLHFYELERVLYEVGYELQNRPDWIDIPLRGLCALTAPKGSP